MSAGPLIRFRCLARLDRDPTAFRRYLAAEIERMEITQRELAGRAGVDHSTISRLLGGREPMLVTAIRLAKSLDAYDRERSGR